VIFSDAIYCCSQNVWPHFSKETSSACTSEQEKASYEPKLSCRPPALGAEIDVHLDHPAYLPFSESHHRDLESSLFPDQRYSASKRPFLAVRALPPSYDLCNRPLLFSCKPYAPIIIAINIWSAPPDLYKPSLRPPCSASSIQLA
jgi:hypothetical protein